MSLLSANCFSVSYSDPDGDDPLLGAGIWLLANGISNLISGQNFFKGGFQAALFGALGGGARELILGSGLSGGIANLLNRGSFSQGLLTGIFIGAFNHALHSGLSGVDPIEPPKDANGKYKLEGFPDAEYQGKSKGLGRRHVWKLKDGKYLEWTSKNGVVEMYDKTGKKWLGKFNPTTGQIISTTSKIGRVASFVGKGITIISERLTTLSSILIYTGPGSGFENYKDNNMY